MSDFLSRLGGAALNDLRGTPLDRILNHLMGGQAGASGLESLVDRLRSGGLGQQVDSWISSGRNEPVEPRQLETALGDREVDQLSRETGMDRGGLLGALSALLPGLVDGLTPRGQMPRSDEEVQGGLGGLLGGLLGGRQGAAGGLGGLLGGAAGGGGLGGLLGALLGGQGASPEAGTGAAGGPGAPFGGAGGDAQRHPGLGGSLDTQGLEDQGLMPRAGPVPLPQDDRGPGYGRDEGLPQGTGPVRKT
jgi:uncharacterized protein YidB (DUF937 family)